MNNTQKLIIAQRELIDNLSYPEFAVTYTTIKNNTLTKQFKKKIAQLKKKIANLEQKIIEEESSAGENINEYSLDKD